MAVAAAVACVVVACVYNCVCVIVAPSLLDRARVATRDGATHSNECARSTAGRVVAAAVVAVVAVVAACVLAACVCVLVFSS